MHRHPNSLTRRRALVFNDIRTPHMKTCGDTHPHLHIHFENRPPLLVVRFLFLSPVLHSSPLFNLLLSANRCLEKSRWLHVYRYACCVRTYVGAYIFAGQREGLPSCCMHAGYGNKQSAEMYKKKGTPLSIYHRYRWGCGKKSTPIRMQTCNTQKTSDRAVDEELASALGACRVCLEVLVCVGLGVLLFFFLGRATSSLTS